MKINGIDYSKKEELCEMLVVYYFNYISNNNTLFLTIKSKINEKIIIDTYQYEDMNIKTSVENILNLSKLKSVNNIIVSESGLSLGIYDELISKFK